MRTKASALRMYPGTETGIHHMRWSVLRTFTEMISAVLRANQLYIDHPRSQVVEMIW